MILLATTPKVELASQVTTVYGMGPVFGSDGPIPHRYRTNLNAGIQAAWRLTYSRVFLDVFRRTVARLTYREDLPVESYVSALNTMTLNLAETSRNPLAINEVKGITHLEGSQGSAPALTSVQQGKTWLREFLLRGDPRRIGGVIMHEAAHYAGAKNDPLAEYALQILDRYSNLPR
jgi:hypothetical protein